MGRRSIIAIGSRIAVGFCAGLFLVGNSYGDMTGAAQLGAGLAAGQMPRQGSDAFDSLAIGTLADLDWFAVRSVPLRSTYDGSREPDPPSHVLADRQGSMHLCLCALLGLGLFKSVPCARRLPLGAIPAWCREGGPSEVGHCLAISRDCASVLLLCFHQPEVVAVELRPVYRSELITFLRRQGRFVSTGRVPRGPPLHFSRARF
jgi:hypothetical protein